MGPDITTTLEACFRTEYDDLIAFAGMFPHEAIARFGTPRVRDAGASRFRGEGVGAARDARAATIAAELGEPEPDDRTRAFCHVVLRFRPLMIASPDPDGMLHASFSIFESGWAPGSARSAAED